jgi:hypothetical protein
MDMMYDAHMIDQHMQVGTMPAALYAGLEQVRHKHV